MKIRSCPDICSTFCNNGYLTEMLLLLKRTGISWVKDTIQTGSCQIFTELILLLKEENNVST
jgi:hypothetical protein